MKKLYILGALLLIAAAGITLFTGCEEIAGGKPTSFTIEAASDTTVKLTWAVPTEGTPDKYVVYFKALSSASFTNVIELGNTVFTYTHDPSGSTGAYYVAAKFGSTEYNADEKSTIPISTAAITVGELNSAELSGYGWDVSTGTGAKYSMTTTANVTKVDFYVTNFAAPPGFATPYNIASPNEGPTDAGGVVPAGSWRVNGISNSITDPQIPLPKYISGTTYFNFTQISSYPTYVAVKTTDGYYGLVKVDGLNTTTGTVQTSSWFQLIEGLRLIKH